MSRLLRWFVVVLVITSSSLLAQSIDPNQGTGGLSLKNTPKTSGDFRYDLFTGSATYNYIFDFPVGVGGIGPDLALSYNSSDTDGFGIVGYGWSLSVPRIFRQSKTGLEDLYTADQFVIGGEEMVSIDPAQKLFMKKDGADLSKYFREGDGWRVVDDSGNTLIYGDVDTARLADPKDPNKVFSWMLTEKRSIHGPKVRYVYMRDEGQVYLDTVSYVYDDNNAPLYTVKLDYITKTRTPESRRTGFSVRTSKLLSTVKLLVNNTVAKTYTLSYDSTTTVNSHLTGITLADSDKTYSNHIFTYLTGKDEHLLGKIDNGRGLVTELAYAPSTSYTDEAGTRTNHIPLVTKTLQKITTKDTVAQTELIESLSYAGAYFYYLPTDIVNREYAGFHQVTMTDNLGKKQIAYFHQGQGSKDGSSQGEYDDHISKKGRVYRNEIYNNGTLIRTSITKWNRQDIGQGRDLVLPLHEVQIDYAGGVAQSATATGYQYDNFGNISQQTLYGFVTITDNAGTFVDKMDDKRTVVSTYAINMDANILHTTSQQELRDNDGNRVSLSQLLYDNLPFGQVAKGLVTSEKRWLNAGDRYITNTYSYTDNGQISSKTDPRGATTSYEYDEYDFLPVMITNALGHSVQYEYDYTSGSPKSFVDLNGQEKMLTYDALGRVLTMELSDGTQMQTTEYVDTTTPTSAKQEVFTGEGDSVETILYFNGSGKTLQTRTSGPKNNQYSVSSTWYDAHGNATVTSVPVFQTGELLTPPDTSTPALRVDYDSLSRPVAQKTAPGETTTITYIGTRQTVTDARGVSKDLSYDAYGNLLTVTEHNGTETYATTYGYNPLNALIAITDAKGQVRSFVYDSLGRLVKAEDIHAAGDIDFITRSYGYDDAGNATSLVYQNGERVDYEYDLLGRLKHENFMNNDMPAEYLYSYDAPSEIGQLDNVIHRQLGEEMYRQAYDYNNLGHLTDETFTYPQKSYHFNYDIDLLGQLREITYPDGDSVSYTMTGNWLKNVLFNGSILATIEEMTPTGSIEKLIYDNGTTQINTYDPVHSYRLDRRYTINTNGETPVIYQNLDYTFDSVGNITRIRDTGTLELTKDIQYTYDDLSRLTHASYTGANNIEISYSYDSIGNMLSASDIGSYTYSAGGLTSPQAVTSIGGVSTLSYDARGNVSHIVDPERDLSLIHNARNELTRSTKVDGVATNYVYDASGKRVKKSDATSVYHYVNDYLEVQDLPRNAEEIVIVPPPSEPEPEENPNPEGAPSTTGETEGEEEPTETENPVTGEPEENTEEPSSTEGGESEDDGETPPETESQEENPNPEGAPSTPEEPETPTTVIQDAPDTITRKYVLLGNVRVATIETRKMPDGNEITKKIYHFTDHLSSASVDTDEQGEILQFSDYKPFGGELTKITRSDYSNHFLFAGKELDNETNLQYFEARYYDNTVTKFIEQDPIYWVLGMSKVTLKYLIDPQQQNSYSYTANRPITYADPSGLCVWDACIVEGTAAYTLGSLAVTTGGFAAWQLYGDEVTQAANDIAKKGAEVAEKAYNAVKDQAAELAEKAAEAVKNEIKDQIKDRIVDEVVEYFQESSSGGTGGSNNDRNKDKKDEIIKKIGKGEIDGKHIMKDTKFKDPKYSGENGEWIKKAYYDKDLKTDFHWMEKVGGSGPDPIGTRAQIKSI